MRGKTSINRARNRHRTTAKTKSESNKSKKYYCKIRVLKKKNCQKIRQIEVRSALLC